VELMEKTCEAWRTKWEWQDRVRTERMDWEVRLRLSCAAATKLVACENQVWGCPSQCRAMDQKQHQDRCEFRLVDCTWKKVGCRERPHARVLEQHATQCVHRSVSCRWQCGKTILVKDQEQHEEKCDWRTVQCENADEGCQQQFPLRNSLQHQTACPFRKLPCSFKHAGCTEIAGVAVISEHEKTCRYSQHVCTFQGCKQNLQGQDPEEHKARCEWRIVNCPNQGCSQRQPFRDLQQHRDTCPFRIRSCRYAHRGCDKSMTARDEAEHHRLCDFREEPCPNCRKPQIHGQLKAHEQQCRQNSEEVTPCRYHEQGCAHTPFARDLEAHETKVCEFRPVPCEFKQCLEKPMAKDRPDHVQNCKYRPVDCRNKSSGCGDNMTFVEEQAHAQICEYRLVECRYFSTGCAVKICYNQAQEHARVCGYRKQQCEYVPLGCDQTDCYAQDLAKHELECRYRPVECDFKFRGCTTKPSFSEKDDHQAKCRFRFEFPRYWANSDEHNFQQMVLSRGLEPFEQMAQATYVSKPTRDRPCPVNKCADIPRGGCEHVLAGGDPGLPLGYVVRKVIRIEDSEKWVKYAEARETIKNTRGDGYGKWAASAEPGLLTSKVVEDHAEAFAPLDHGINEMYLMHGTNIRASLSVGHNGVNLRAAGTHRGSHAGEGFYMSESITKADEYASDDRGEVGAYYDDVYAVVVLRVTMGKMNYTENFDKEAAAVSMGANAAFDSLLCDRLKAVDTFREFVVYNPDQAYAEYVILYERQYRIPDFRAPGRLGMPEDFSFQVPVYWENCYKNTAKLCSETSMCAPPNTGLCRKTQECQQFFVRKEVDVHSPTFALLQHMVNASAQQGKGGGRSTKLIRAERIEASKLWQMYVERKLEIRKQAQRKPDRRCKPIAEVDGAKESGNVLTTAIMDAPGVSDSSISVTHLELGINEVLAFHGTSKDACENILEGGFQIHDASEHRSRFGKGAYLAEDVHKSLEYCVENDGCNIVLLCRVTCGEIYYTTRNTEEDATTTAQGLSMNCTIGNPRGEGPREIVVFEKDQLYPEFVLYLQGEAQSEFRL